MAKYRVQQNDQGKFCIHPMMDDGSMGEAMSCFASEDVANARMKQMMASEGKPAQGMSKSVKILAQTDDTATLGGWLVVYDGSDLMGDTFTKSTDYWLDRLGTTKPVLYDHGLNDGVKMATLGTGVVSERDEGLWFEMQLEKSKRYVGKVLELADQGALGLSSGAVLHLIRKEGKTFTSWPIAEGSLTPMPAEPRTLGVEALRFLVESDPTLKSLLPEDAPVAEESVQEAASVAAEITVRDLSTEPPGASGPSSTKNATENEMEINELAEQVKGLSDNMERILKHLEDTPSLRGAGYVSQDGGKADPALKSFGDFLMALKRGDTKRLAAVYGSTKDLSEGAGTTGGYLVPTDASQDLLRPVYETNPIISLCRRVPVGTVAGTYPALNVFAAPTAGAGHTAYSAGVTSANTAEGGTLTETQATFLEIAWRVYKKGGIVEVSNELVQDSAQAIEALLRSLIVIELTSKLERDILRGTGNGEPLGIFNSDAVIGVATTTNDVWAWADAGNMLARFKATSGSLARTRWIMHPGVMPDMFASGFVTGNVARDIGSLGFGQPIYSEHMNQANGDDVLLADLGSYLLFTRDELSIAYSEHAAFASDKGTWRFTQRLDGQPWLRSAITLADPTGSYTVSPFVFHDD